MKNLFTKFFAALLAFMAGVFTSKSERGRISKMNEHNQRVYQERLKSLKKFAEKFILPVCKRDKNGNLIRNKRYLRYQRFIKERKEELLLKKGLKEFFINNRRIIALNKYNAEKKYRKLNNAMVY